MLEAAAKDLARSGISVSDAEAADIFAVENAQDIYPDFRPEPALVIPYYTPEGELIMFGSAQPFCRVRYIGGKKAKGFGGKELPKYGQPAASGSQVYFAPGIDWPRLLDSPKEPLLITEGEKKSLAGCLAGYPVIGLGGVFNWVKKGGELLPALANIVWEGRDVYIVFDSDAATNPNIQLAEARLVEELQHKRGARCYLVRLPSDKASKVGLDDYLVSHGAPAFAELLRKAPALGALDAKVVALNRSVAWIEAEGMVYDLEDKRFIKKDNFITGSRFSALTHTMLGGAQRTAPKAVSVAKTWLTHAHAQRFGEILFRPSEGRTVQTQYGRPALNMWEPWAPEAGDVRPFLALTDYLFQSMAPKDRDLPLKLMAYKAQHPQEKIPLALVLVGTPGCGKTLWSEVLQDAFSPYSAAVTSKSFHGEFQGWLETSLLAVINEAEGEDMLKGADILKALISDLQRPMNEKFRPARQINTYTSYILTSNRRVVGAFAADDRRMIVVDCPKPSKECKLYTDLSRKNHWRQNGGPSAVLHYLLSYDLKGWEPPAAAPMTTEKHMAYKESLTVVQELADQMQTADENTIKMWLDQSAAWADTAILSSNPHLVSAAQSTLEGISHMQIRPWYEPRELALLFPNLVASLLGSRYDRNTPPGRISRELREAGIRYLVCKDDPKGFKWKGVTRQYLIVCDFDDWTMPLAQADFERLMKSWETYGARRK